MFKNSILFCFFVSNIIFANQSFSDAEYQCLDKLALQFDPYDVSRKGSNGHNYTEVYSKYFGPIKELPLKFLEIGINQGISVQIWESYFKNAELHFIDNRFDDIKYFSQRSQYHLADQASIEDLSRVINKIQGGFDIIIDDGGHYMHQQIISFKTLFPHLKSGGMYIVEDLHTSYWKENGGYGSSYSPESGPGTCIDFLKQLVDDVNYVGARGAGASHKNIPDLIKKDLNIYRDQIYSIHFYDSLCIITKR